jgi:DNA (cytosine-5)-methyltransferase 1
MHASKTDPFIASYYGPKGENDRAPRSIDEPIATIPTENRFAMVEGVIIPQQNFDDQAVFDSLDRPLRAVQTRNGTGIAEPEAFITPKFGEHGTQVPRTHKLDEPVPTITGHGAGMLVGATTYGVTTPGKPYVIVSGTVIELDILYRMLTNDELARAMSFKTDEYDYVLSGSAAEQTRQIGNAVAVNTAKALISHALEYRFAEARRMVAA